MNKLLGTLGAVILVTITAQTSNAREQSNAALQALDDQLPGDLINDPADLGWAISGSGVDVKSVKDDSIPGGGAASNVKVNAKGADPWAAQAMIPLLTGVEDDQIVTVGFYARTISADTRDRKGLITVRVQQNVSPYSGFIDKTLPIGPDWAFYEASGKANRSIRRGEAVVALQLAGAKQEIQIGQMIVVANANAIATGQPASSAGAQTATIPDSLKDKGTLMADPGDRRNWAFYGPGLTHEPGSSSVMGVTSIKAANSTTTGNALDGAITIPLKDAIASGDSLIIAVAARTNDSSAAEGAGTIGVRVLRNVDPWPGFGDHQLSFAAGKWQIITVTVDADQAIPTGEAAVQLQLGGAKQDLDIGPVYVIKASGGS